MAAALLFCIVAIWIVSQSPCQTFLGHYHLAQCSCNEHCLENASSAVQHGYTHSGVLAAGLWLACSMLSSPGGSPSTRS